jgi:hypothetical protein
MTVKKWIEQNVHPMLQELVEVLASNEGLIYNTHIHLDYFKEMMGSFVKQAQNQISWLETTHEQLSTMEKFEAVQWLNFISKSRWWYISGENADQALYLFQLHCNKVGITAYCHKLGKNKWRIIV